MGKRSKRRIPKTRQEKKEAVYELRHLLATVDSALLMEKLQGRDYTGGWKTKNRCFTSYLLKDMKEGTGRGWYTTPFIYIRRLNQGVFLQMFKASKQFLPGLTNDKLTWIYKKIRDRPYRYRDHMPINKFNKIRIFPLSQDKYRRFAEQMQFEGVCDKDADGVPLDSLTVNKYSDKYRPDYNSEDFYSTSFCYVDRTVDNDFIFFTLRYYRER